jgi:hypothetical protein
MNNKIYYLFGSKAAELYIETIGSEQEILDKFLEEELDYGLFVYDEALNHPSDLLDAYDGWQGFAEITESFYNLLTNKTK